jgi:hypothetical protein
VHLVKTECTSAADDIRDIIAAEVQGRATEAAHQTRAELEEEKRAEAYFFTVIARRLDERLTWAEGKIKIVELGNRDGYHLTLKDREGRPYEVQVYYSELVEVAAAQRAFETERGPVLMADHIAEKLEAARRRYFERMYGQPT